MTDRLEPAAKKTAGVDKLRKADAPMSVPVYSKLTAVGAE
jgi:hypothetical protein